MPNFVPAAQAHIELRILNSRFIAIAAPTPSVVAARALIAIQRSAMPDANHHVYGYVIGHGATTTMGMSDDGEPPGTAGRPVLSVVKGSGLGDVTVVVTRYFGGTLLGTGGLVHAYGDAAREVLAAVVREAKIERSTLRISTDYASYEQVKRLALAHDAHIASEAFAADVTLEVVLPTAAKAQLAHELTALTAGRVQIVE